MSTAKSKESELSRMKVSELRKLAEQLGVETPSKKLKAQLVKAILEKQTGQARKPRRRAKPAAPPEQLLGTVINYRQGMHRQNTHDLLIKIQGVDSADSASKYIGRRVVWKSQTMKKIAGKLVSSHGKGGTLIGRFRKGLPGQALGTVVEII